MQLPSLLARLPKDGLRSSVYQLRWQRKGLPTPSLDNIDGTCRWSIERVEHGTKDGKPVVTAFGQMYWKGKLVTPPNKLVTVKGATKYSWAAAQPLPTPPHLPPYKPKEAPETAQPA